MLIKYDPDTQLVQAGDHVFDFYTGDTHLIGIANILLTFKLDECDVQTAFEDIKREINRNILGL